MIFISGMRHRESFVDAVRPERYNSPHVDLLRRGSWEAVAVSRRACSYIDMAVAALASGKGVSDQALTMEPFFGNLK